MSSRKLLIIAAVAATLWPLWHVLFFFHERYILLKNGMDPAEYTLTPPPKRAQPKPREFTRIPILPAGEEDLVPGLDDYPRVADETAWGDALAAKAPAAGYRAYYLTTGDVKDVSPIPNMERLSEFRGDAPRPPLEDFAERWRNEPKRLIASEDVPAIRVRAAYNDL